MGASNSFDLLVPEVIGFVKNRTNSLGKVEETRRRGTACHAPSQLVDEEAAYGKDHMLI